MNKVEQRLIDNNFEGDKFYESLYRSVKLIKKPETALQLHNELIEAAINFDLVNGPCQEYFKTLKCRWDWIEFRGNEFLNIFLNPKAVYDFSEEKAFSWKAWDIIRKLRHYLGNDYSCDIHYLPGEKYKEWTAKANEVYSTLRTLVEDERTKWLESDSRYQEIQKKKLVWPLITGKRYSVKIKSSRRRGTIQMDSRLNNFWAEYYYFNDGGRKNVELASTSILHDRKHRDEFLMNMILEYQIKSEE
ncbi:hypothetical protein FACS189444_1400 [Spirochaetia bacterium]|nr:hypothetical protein FACS189444_1400 [Spirochaetia bacterium]